MKYKEKIYSYTRKQVIEIMNNLCNEYNLKLYFKRNKDLRNCAYSSGNEIILYTFDSLEYMLISFFHEFAHCKLNKKVPFIVDGYSWNNTSKFQFELWITMLGIEFAQSREILFSDEAISWLIDQNKTYINLEMHKLFISKANKSQYKITQETYFYE